MHDKEIISCRDDPYSKNSSENKEKQNNCQIKEIEDHCGSAENSAHSRKESTCEESDNSCGCGCSEVSNENEKNHNHSQHREHYDCDEHSGHNQKETNDSCSCGCEDTDEKGHKTCEIESTAHACGCGCSEGLLEERESLWTWKNLFVMITSAVLLPVGLYFNYFTGQEIVSEILFLAVIALSGYEIIKSGIMGLLKGNFSMNLLMTVAVVVSFAIGSGAEGAVIIFLFYISKFLEGY
ncbi:MAG: hypothetical protein ABFD07_03000, partial [Methanobacterium sp.]